MVKVPVRQLVIVILMVVGCSPATMAQQLSIKYMEWGSNLEINLELSNDSSYILDVNQLPHSNRRFAQNSDGYTYYPARLSEEFINRLKQVKIGDADPGRDDTTESGSDKTLWSALHLSIGGGFRTL